VLSPPPCSVFALHHNIYWVTVVVELLELPPIKLIQAILGRAMSAVGAFRFFDQIIKPAKQCCLGDTISFCVTVTVSWGQEQSAIDSCSSRPVPPRPFWPPCQTNRATTSLTSSTRAATTGSHRWFEQVVCVHVHHRPAVAVGQGEDPYPDPPGLAGQHGHHDHGSIRSCTGCTAYFWHAVWKHTLNLKHFAEWRVISWLRKRHRWTCDQFRRRFTTSTERWLPIAADGSRCLTRHQ
jgi:hypothetical protein